MWSWKAAKIWTRRGLIWGFVWPLLINLILGLIVMSFTDRLDLIRYVRESVRGGLGLGVISALFSGGVLCLIGGLHEMDIIERINPSQIFWQSALKTVVVGGVGGLVSGFIFAAFTYFSDHSGDIISNYMSNTLLPVAPFVGILGGLSFALRYGGIALISHFTLRYILYRNGDIPWNYIRFLDYAADRIFLRKVGGGYIFIHRMLME